MEAEVTGLSAETQRLIALSRGADDAPPSREQAVRERLIARLGEAALAGVAVTSATVAATKAVGAAGASVLSGGAPVAAGTAGASAASVGGASALVKTAASLIVVFGLGTAAMQNETVAEQVHEWPVAAAMQIKTTTQRIWQLCLGSEEESRLRPAEEERPDALGFDARRHALLMAIARRPDRPVAKEAELVLILRAEEALLAGDVSSATGYLDQHEARFANDALSENREVLRVLVDCARGAAEEARSRAEELVRRSPASDQIAQLRACALVAPIVKALPASSTVAPSKPDKPNF
jgi:ElaB/YqjD/DUF883 family membrane-anchored ribosome-binding protein